MARITDPRQRTSARARAEGFFILRTSEDDYLHSGVPLKVWQEFKTASSFGRFYSERIRGRYRMYLGQ
ncbi:MAG: KTSC domain-containing protein [Flavobacteriales bacterium]|nr:KTSC domain-containing protein [Flavobacteriales bacterium]